MGVLILEELLQKDVQVAGVVARWDDPSPKQWYPSVTDFARKNNLPVYTPKNINDPSFVSEVSGIAPDIIFTVFYPRIYSKRLLEAVSSEAYNLHFGPLPRYRGCFPGAWAIINGESNHGVTIHRMGESADSGDIVSKTLVSIDGNETGISLYKKCEKAGLKLFSQTWHNLESGAIDLVPQNSQEALYYNREIPFGGIIDFSWSASMVDRFVRALTFPPFLNPAAYQNGRWLIVDKCEVVELKNIVGKPGQILSLEDGIVVQAGKGIIKITDCRDHNGKQVSLKYAIKSYKIQVGDSLVD